MKRSRWSILSIILALTIPMRAFAAENSYSRDAAAAANKAYEAKQYSGVGNSEVHSMTLRDFFDPVYYSFANPVAVAEAGSDPEDLFQHFITKGILQGYLCNLYFNIRKYRVDHPELESILGNNWDMWVLNFFMGSGAPTSLRATFDSVFYAATYPEIALQYGNDPEALYDHYISIGLYNGYLGNPYFDVLSYCTAHPELVGVYGYNWDAWVVDFYTKGISGGEETDGKTNSQVNTYTYDDDSDSSETITDGKGNILVPIEEVIKYHSLDELREKCGDSLVLITDKYGYVTFVGGHFTDVQVSDEYDSIKAIECMLDLIGFQEGKILRFSQSVEDSIGNTYYQFAEADKDSGFVNYLSMIALGVDDSGKVISLSSNCGVKLSSEIDNGYEYKSKNQVSIEFVRACLKSRNLDLVSEKIDTMYSPAFNCYGNVFYGIDESGYIFEYFYNPVYDKFGFIGKYSDIPTKENGLYAFSYLFSDDVETKLHVFKDYFGNDVTLSVASIIRDGKTYYYLVDKNRKIAANVQNSVQNDYFNKGFESLEDVYTYYVQSMVTIQKTYDFYKDLGFIDQNNNKPLIISFNENDTNENAYCSYLGGFFNIRVNNNKVGASFDVLAHEMGHLVLYSSAPTLHYLEEGSILEGYADIAGNILEMLYYLAGDKTIGDVDLKNWLLGESVNSIQRSMGEPEKYKGASRVGGENYVITNIDSQNSHYHATILGNICYRMNKELDIPLEDLFRIWYDSVPNITSRSTYKDVQGYIVYSTMLHGYPELMDKVTKLFEDANVDGYSDNWLTLQPTDDYVTYVPAIIDNYSDIYESFFANTNNFIKISEWRQNGDAWTDKYGNIGALIKKGDELPFYPVITIFYEGKYNDYFVYMPDSNEQTHLEANDIMSAVFSSVGKTDDIEGFVSVNYEVNDAEHVYMIHRIYGETDNHGYIYINLIPDEHKALSLCDNALYGIFQMNNNGEDIIYTFNTSDFKDSGYNPVIKLTNNPNQEFRVNVDVIYTEGNSAALNQVSPAGQNYAAALALGTTTEKKKDTDEVTADSVNNETPEGENSGTDGSLSDISNSDSPDIVEEENPGDSLDGFNEISFDGEITDTTSGVERMEAFRDSRDDSRSGNNEIIEEINTEDQSDKSSTEGENVEIDSTVNSCDSGNTESIENSSDKAESDVPSESDTDSDSDNKDKVAENDTDDISSETDVDENDTSTHNDENDDPLVDTLT